MNLLIVSLAFAPFSGVGAARMTSLAEYLVKSGVGVSVFCYGRSAFCQEELLRRVPKGVTYYRIGKKGNRRKNIRNIHKKLEVCIQKQPFDLILFSVGPFEVMDAIYPIWKKYHIPYILDYRDIWVFEPNRKKTKLLLRWKFLLYDLLYFPVERKIMRNAQKVVFVTKMCKKNLIRRHHLKISNCRLLLNGYDKIPIAGQKALEGDRSVMTLAVAGKFYSYNEKAAECCVRACASIREFTAKIVHIGNKDEQLELLFGGTFYQNLGFLSYDDTIAQLQKADVFLISYRHFYGLGTKVYDYIALNKPVIYVGIVPSELADFLRQFEHVYICKENVWEVRNAILDIYTKHITELTRNDRKKFARKYINREYMQLIQECITNAGLRNVGYRR